MHTRCIYYNLLLLNVNLRAACGVTILIYAGRFTTASILFFNNAFNQILIFGIFKYTLDFRPYFQKYHLKCPVYFYGNEIIFYLKQEPSFSL